MRAYRKEGKGRKEEEKIKMKSKITREIYEGLLKQIKNCSLYPESNGEPLKDFYQGRGLETDVLLRTLLNKNEYIYI